MVALDLTIWGLLANCTARLEFGKNSRATGTLVGPGVLVTCAHVLSSSDGNLRVVLNGREIAWTTLEEGTSPFPDIAVLKIATEDHTWVSLSPGAQPGDKVYAFGFPDDMPAGDSFTGEMEGWSDLGVGQNLKFKGGQVRPGFSGAALFNQRTASVCGIVRTTRDRGFDLGGRAVPAEEVVRIVAGCTHPSLDLHTKSEMPWWTQAVSKLAVSTTPFPLAQLSRSYGRKLQGSLEAAEFFCGRESELALLQDFWDGGGPFVLALTGIGGSGKTAIVRQFLDKKGWLRPGGRSEETLYLLVWSFYDYPSTSDFLQSATEFFSSTGAGPTSTVDRLLDSIARIQGRALIVLDGLEKMQAPGTAGVAPRGTIEDPALRQFLLSVADGEVANCRVIVTTRFAMTDFSARPAVGYREVQLDELDNDAAIDLLRRLGVTDPMEPLLRGYGRHALTLDLLGRLVREFFQGEVPSHEILPPLASSAGTPDVEKQAARLARVLRAYQSYLTELETALMRRVSLFRRPVGEGFLVKLIKAGGKDGFGESLTGLSERELGFVLRRLAGLRLIWIEAPLGGTKSVTCHPAVRDYFYSTIDDTGTLHRTVQASLLSLAEQPGQGSVRTRAQVDLIEELIYHTVMIGQREEAFEIYREWLGYLRLGWQKGDHARGVNVLSMITTGQVGSSDLEWNPEQMGRLSIDYALYLKNLGALDEATDVLNAVRDEIRSAANLDLLPRSEVALALQNLSAILLLRGFLPDAERVAREGLAMAIALGDARLEHDSRVRLGTALSMQGSFGPAEDELRAASNISPHEGRVVRDVVAVRLGPLLRRVGRLDEALSLLSAEKERFEELHYGTIVARLDVALSDVLADLGRLDEALVLLERVGEWVTTGTDIEMVIAGSVAQARVALLKGEPEAARERCDRALRLSRRHGYLTYLYDALIVVGNAYVRLGNTDDAVRVANEILLGGVDSMGREIAGAADPRIAYQWAEEDAQRLHDLASGAPQGHG